MITYCKLKTTFILAMVTLVTSAEPTVTDVVAKQRFPWNGLVDITCKVSGIEGTAKTFWFTAAAVMPDTGKIRNASHFWVVQNGTNSTDLAVRANGIYRLVWDALADIGRVTHDNMVVRVDLDVHRKVQLWEGGPYWADTNIGAEKPWDYGYYFWWGDTIGYKCEGDSWVVSDGSASSFTFENANTPTAGKGCSTLRGEGWITTDGFLAPEHDAAHVHWGGNWRMPTKQEISDLNSKCNWSWTTINGVNGYRVSGEGDYAFASIFLPCAGRVESSSNHVYYNDGRYGSYWSSVPYKDDYNAYFAYRLYFTSSARGMDYDGSNSGYRSNGRSVRPVQGFVE